MCPYGKSVAAMPKVYRDAKTRIFVFAGEEAWPRAKQYLDAGEPYCARQRYVLVCPERVEDHERKQSFPFQPWKASWPVASLDVLIIDCGASERLLEHLVRALRRDAARSADKMACPAIQHMDAGDMKCWGSFERYFDWEISTKQRWHFAHFDPIAMADQARRDYDRKVARMIYALRHEDPSGQIRAICEALPHGSYGHEALQQAFT
jgi:hypothetical protein